MYRGAGSLGRNRTKVIKILFVLSSFKLGGAERQMIYLMKNIDRSHFAPAVCFFHNDGPLINELPDDIKIFDFTGIITGKFSKLFHLTRIILKLDPDVVYSNLPETNIPLGFVRFITSLLKGNIKYGISVVNNIDYYSKGKKLLANVVFPKMDVVFACATGLYDQLREKVGIRPEKLRVLFNGVNIDFIEKRSFEQVNDPWLNSEARCLITVANFRPQKCLDDLIRVFYMVNNKFPSYLLIIGDGRLRKDLERLAASLGLQDRIEFTGFQYNSNKYVSRADVFISSSRYEGLGTVLLEAAIVGTPIVCTDAPFGSRDVVKDQSMGIRVKVGDLESMSDGILRILGDRIFAEMSSENVKEHVIRCFDLRVIVKQFESALKNLFVETGSRKC